MIRSVVAAETVIRDPIAVVTAALLPGVVLRLPVMRALALPSNLLDVYLCRLSLLCRLVVLPLTRLALLILLPLGLLLPFCLLLHFGLLLPLFCSVVLQLTLLPLLILLSSSLLLLLGGVVLLLALLVLLPSRLLLLLLRRIVLLLTLLLFGGLGLRLLFRPSLLLLFPRLSFFVLFLLPRISWSDDSEQQKKSCRPKNSDWFHGVPSTAFTFALHSPFTASTVTPVLASVYRVLTQAGLPVTQRGCAIGSGTIQIH